MACSTWASAKWPIRHLAITGMETAPMIFSIMSGSLILATPPWARMSAGTRSSAITATAPASSAIFAWSAVTTSMITPPLSMSAMPRLTRAVPVSAAAPPSRAPGMLAALLTDTINLTYSLGGLTSMVGARQPAYPAPSGNLAGRVPAAGEVEHVGPAALRPPGPERVVDLEELRQRRAPGQPEHADQPAAARVAGDGYRVVVEPARQEHLVGCGLQLGEQLVAPAQLGQGRAEAGLAQRRPQRPGQVALGQLVRLTGGPGVVRRPGQQQAGRRVEQAAGGELQRHRAAPHQRGVQGRAGGLHPRVQAVEPARAPGHIHPDQDRDGDDDDADGQRAHGTTSTFPAAGTTAWYTLTTSRATTGQS